MNCGFGRGIRGTLMATVIDVMLPLSRAGGRKGAMQRMPKRMETGMPTNKVVTCVSRPLSPIFPALLPVQMVVMLLTCHPQGTFHISSLMLINGTHVTSQAVLPPTPPINAEQSLGSPRAGTRGGKATRTSGSKKTRERGERKGAKECRVSTQVKGQMV